MTQRNYARSVHVRTRRHRVSWKGALCSALLILLSCKSNEPSETVIACTTDQTCLDSAELAERLGRCVAEAYCLAGECDGRCVAACQVVDPTLNPCDDGLICNEPSEAEPGATWNCTALPIRCESPSQCPVFRPQPTGSWSCSDGFCRFPGFHYFVED
jgi:hypothetical protein